MRQSYPVLLESEDELSSYVRVVSSLLVCYKRSRFSYHERLCTHTFTRTFLEVRFELQQFSAFSTRGNTSALCRVATVQNFVGYKAICFDLWARVPKIYSGKWKPCGKLMNTAENGNLVENERNIGRLIKSFMYNAITKEERATENGKWKLGNEKWECSGNGNTS